MIRMKSKPNDGHQPGKANPGKPPNTGTSVTKPPK